MLHAPAIDSQQALRIRRLLMAGASYLMFVVLMLFANAMRLLEPKLTWRIVAAGVAVNLLLYAAFRTGLNLRFRDPSLTAVQVVAALTLASYGMYFADHARGVFLMVYLVIILPGVFQLGTRQLLFIGLSALAAYGTVIGLAQEFKPETVDLEVELLQWAVLGAVLPWFALVGGYLSRLRKTMRESNLRLQDALARIQDMAIRDELTGAYNRRYLMDRLQQEKSRCDRGGGSLCVCMMDIDHFKLVNDQHGHQAGDKVLRTFAKLAQSRLRPTDCFGRYGGEEFVLVLAETAIGGALTMAERLRQAIRSEHFGDLGDARWITASFGATQYRPGEGIMTTLARADEALYEAKHACRNRVESRL